MSRYMNALMQMLIRRQPTLATPSSCSRRSRTLARRPRSRAWPFSRERLPSSAGGCRTDSQWRACASSSSAGQLISRIASTQSRAGFPSRSSRTVRAVSTWAGACAPCRRASAVRTPGNTLSWVTQATRTGRSNTERASSSRQAGHRHPRPLSPGRNLPLRPSRQIPPASPMHTKSETRRSHRLHCRR